MRQILLSFILMLLLCSCENNELRSGVDYVDLFIGTANDQGQMDPAATVPYGMVKVGPDCVPASHVGYDYDVLTISGFSINRLSGTGCNGAGGNISVRPAMANEEIEIVKPTETAYPGYYSTKLSNEVKVELTATNSVALEKFTFPEDSEKTIHIDFSRALGVFIDAEYEIASSTEIYGWISAKNTCKEGAYKFYFAIISDNEFEVVEQNETDVLLTFDDASTVTELRIGISGIGIADAKKEADIITDTSFEAIAEIAHEQWKEKLIVFHVEGDEEDKLMFYTSLYRTFLSPFNVTSSDGAFINSRGEKEITYSYTYYSSWSLWDTYRTKFPLLTITDPGMMSHFCWSLCKLYETGKVAWSTLHEVVPTTRTEHSAIMLLDAYRKGITGFDLQKTYGYILEEAAGFNLVSPDNYLEAAYDYWAIAQIAKELGKDEDYEKFSELSTRTWQGVWDEKFKTIDDERFDIMHGDGLYEGTLWQYRWAVPFDIEELSIVAGGKDVLKNQLNYFFENSLYNHGNQPDIHAAYIFNKLDAPELTQYWVNQILTQPMKHSYGTHKKFQNPYIDKAYRPVPRSYISEMDDDDGTMAAWYVLSSIGLYPLVVGEPYYELSTPVFDRVTINLSNGKEFKIIKENPNSIYINKGLLNGIPVNGLRLSYEDIMKGGELRLF